MKIELKKRLGKKFPYVYSQNSPKDFSGYRFQRTIYFKMLAIIISIGKNK